MLPVMQAMPLSLLRKSQTNARKRLMQRRPWNLQRLRIPQILMEQLISDLTIDMEIRRIFRGPVLMRPNCLNINRRI